LPLGVYYSLQYLSLSDATALIFLAPLFTGIAGAYFLKENFSRKELLAGRKCIHSGSILGRYLDEVLLDAVCSFVGVILIARPQFLFKSGPQDVPISVDANEGGVQPDGWRQRGALRSRGSLPLGE